MARQRIDRFDGFYDFLSNFYPASTLVDGLEYLSSEAAYQAAKCADPGQRIDFTEQPPSVSKQMGRASVMRPDWDDVKIAVMEAAVRAKFTQNPHLARFLVQTGDAELLEGNTWQDLFWGVDLETGEGENNLGKVLMALRADFQENGLPPMDGQLPWRQETAADGLSLQFRDITQLPCEAIVHPTDEALSICDGLGYAIHRAAGASLQAACQQLDACPVTQARLTEGFDLAASYVIHVAAPSYEAEAPAQQLVQTYWNALDLAAETGIRTIAFPAISVGKWGYPKAEAAALAVDAVRRWKQAHPATSLAITFSCVDLELYRSFCQAL